MVQVLTEEQLYGEDPLGQALGLGLQALSSGFMKAGQERKQQEGMRALGVQLGIPEFRLDEFSKLSPDMAKIAAANLIAQQKQQVLEAKPTIFEKQELTNLAKAKPKLQGRLEDIQRAKQMIANEEVRTGPVIGLVAERTLKTGPQQELSGIASRLLTSGFTTLPRITAEFESFKSGQLSLRNTPEVNMRLLENQERAAVLESKIVERFEELLNKGVSEASALRQAKAQYAKEERSLFKDVKALKNASNKTLAQTKSLLRKEIQRRGLINES